MTRSVFVTLVVAVLSAATSFSQQGAPAPAAPTQDVNIYYQLGPDSLPRDGVPKGEIRGPFVLPSQAYPGTQHTYWVYVPAQYDPTIPASLMIFQDGQAFMDHERRPARAERARQPHLPPRDAGDDRRVHQSRPHARAARAESDELGRPHDEPSHRIQLARRQLRARHRRRAAAGAVQGLQHLEGPRTPRHRRRQLRRHRGVHRRLAASRSVPQGAEHRRQLHQLCAAATRIPTSSARARRSRSASSCRTAATTTAACGRAAPTISGATGSIRTSS